MGTSNAYLLSGSNSNLLVDAGNKGKIQNLEITLMHKGLDFSDLDIVIVTHSHYDHLGCLVEIKERSEAKILVHRDEANFLINGYIPSPKGTSLFSKIICWFGNSFFSGRAKFPPVNPDILVDGECELVTSGSSIKIIPTPGHTSGSICVIINNECAIVGDTLFNVIPGSFYPPFANDKKELIKSWRKILSTGCRTFYPGHGKPFSRDKFKKCFEKKMRH
ncbi:MAG: MBL fold metallo-hydrolase [Methanosarcinaceae archaeon]|nr:MBL fold metallo-hydrolase [Methanosarcinaceae archaeon]